MLCGALSVRRPVHLIRIRRRAGKDLHNMGLQLYRRRDQDHIRLRDARPDGRGGLPVRKQGGTPLPHPPEQRHPLLIYL